MSKRDYQRLPIEQFGRQLIETKDLDPVYVALPKAIEDEAQLKRWLIAYWCTYHCGAASWLSEQSGMEFWMWLRAAAANDAPAPNGGRWPRGHERRHWRGKQALDSQAELERRWGNEPERMVDVIVDCAPNYINLTNKVQEHRGFGPWISFKVADMVDRVLGVHVDFSEAAVFMFKDPVKAALMLWREKHGLPENAKPRDQMKVIHEVVEYLCGEFRDLSAPPLYERGIGLQEVETVLCKWKSHMNGHYPLYNDIDEIGHGLATWEAISETALALNHFLPAPSEQA